MPVLKYALISFNLCLFAQVLAQNPWQWSVEYNLATLRKHTPRMVFTPSGAAHGLELKLFKRTAGNKRWENYYNAPSYGFMAKFFYLGAPREILGNAYSFYPFIEFNIGKKLHLFLSDGIAYFPKPYNIKTNPNQNAIGSHWNRSVCFKALWNVYNFKRLSFFSGVGITHYSNGSIKSPNLGLNFPSIDFQMRQNSVINSEFIKQKNNERLFKKWSFSLLYGIAMKELKVTGGPKFFVYTLAVDGGYHYSDFKSIRVGIEEEYHNVSPYFYIHTVNVDKIDPFKVALRHQVFVSHEWQIGQSAISLSTGYRLNKEVVLGGYALYNKLIVSYRFPKIIKRIEPSLGMILKVNYGVADHLALCLNLRWHKTKTKME